MLPELNAQKEKKIPTLAPIFYYIILDDFTKFVWFSIYFWNTCNPPNKHSSISPNIQLKLILGPAEHFVSYFKVK